MFDFTEIITVKTIDEPSHTSKSARLKLKDNLLMVRKELEKDKFIDNSLLFSRKYLDKSFEFAEISLEKEEDYLLNEIIGNEKILYLKKSSKLDWNCLNELRKLDYGCTMIFDEIKKANKKAYKMKNCELNEMGSEGCKVGVVDFGSKEDWMMKTSLFFSSDVGVQNFLKLGASIGASKNEKFNFETNSSYRFTKYGKASLKFGKYLEPTPEFIEAVKNAIESKSPENFIQITEEFGQFIPTEVIFGGRVHFDDFSISTEHSGEKSNEIAMNANIEVLESNVTGATNRLKGKSNHYNYKCTKLFGGEQPDSLEKFNEEAWIKSLKDYRNWDCIEFRNPISIFQLLPDNDLRKKFIESVGKKIYHSTVEDFYHRLDQSDEFGRPIVFNMNMPPDILKIVQNKNADCNIFATIINTKASDDDIFTCQVLWPTDGKPSLIIHCIQKKFKRRECKLKIGWMAIGYYTDFDFILSDLNAQLDVQKNDFDMSNNPTMIKTELLSFEYDSYIRKAPPCLGIPVLNKLDSSNNSLIIGHHFFNAQEINEEKNKIGACTFSYCSKDNHYVNLPNFTFYTLIISNYPIPNAYDTIPFNYSFMKKKPYIDFNNDITGSSCLNPKYISLYSTKKSNCGPIFLKQKNRRIKIKSFNCKNKTCFICMNKTLILSENNIKCAFFDPFISNNVLTRKM